jgi:hypothetical protein
MAVTKQVYTATGPWTRGQFAGLFEQAFIDAGLMAAWHDSFDLNNRAFRVLKIEHDDSLAYGSTFYYFAFLQDQGDHPGVSIASGWNTATNQPTGTQFIDYHRLPASVANISNNWGMSALSSFNPVSTSSISLIRYTSTINNKQSWFVIQQGVNFSAPFSFLHPQAVLYPWLDLSKGIVNGYSTVFTQTSSNTGVVSFRLQENIRRSLLTGITVDGDTEAFSANSRFHAINIPTLSYLGFGNQSNSTGSNMSGVGANYLGAAAILPVGKQTANPAFTSDYIPICTDLPWSVFTPERLATDFGVFMHYADNSMNLLDRFIVTPGVEEWEILARTNNGIVTRGASPTFLARVV